MNQDHSSGVHTVPVVPRKEDVYALLEESGAVERWRKTVVDQFDKEDVPVGRGQKISVRDQLKQEAAALLEDEGSGVRELVEQCAREHGSGEDGEAASAALVERVRDALYRQNGTMLQIKAFVHRMLHSDGGQGRGSEEQQEGGGGGIAAEIDAEVSAAVETLRKRGQSRQHEDEFRKAVDRRAREVALHSRRVPRAANRATQKPTAHVAAVKRGAFVPGGKRFRRTVVVDEDEEEEGDPLDTLLPMKDSKKGCGGSNSGSGSNDDSRNSGSGDEEEEEGGRKRMKRRRQADPSDGAEDTFDMERGRQAFNDLFGGDSSEDDHDRDDMQEVA